MNSLITCNNKLKYTDKNTEYSLKYMAQDIVFFLLIVLRHQLRGYYSRIILFSVNYYKY